MSRSARKIFCLVSRGSDGFTLLELLVVLMIMALAVSFVGPRFKSRERVGFKVQVRKVVSALRYARRMAIINGRPQEVTLTQMQVHGDADRGQHDSMISWVQKGGVVSSGPSVDATRDGKKGEGETSEKMLFFPDGSNTGASILVRGNSQQALIRVNPVTGKITVK